MTEIENRLDKLEKLITTQAAMTNLLTALVLQTNPSLKSKVANDLRLVQMNLSPDVDSSVVAQITDLRYLLSASQPGKPLESSLEPKLRLVDPPTPD